MNRSLKGLAALVLAAATFAAGCSGTGGTGPGLSPGTGMPQTPQKRKIGHIKATVFVPPKKHQSSREVAYLTAQQKRHAHGKRHANFFSGSATELDFTFLSNNGVAATPEDQALFDFTIYLNDPTECTGTASTGYTCTFVAPAPVGTDGYHMISQECSVSGTTSSQSCASLGGTLSAVGSAFATAIVQLNQVTVLTFTTSSIVGSIDWAPVTYANIVGPGNPTAQPYASNSWLVNPNGTQIPTYQPTPSPGIYSCSANAGSGTGNGCYEPVAQTYGISYGVVLEVRDPSGALIVPSAGGGSVFQTPLYIDASGNPISITWSCFDAASGVTSQHRHAGNRRAHTVSTQGSLIWETGAGPYTNNGLAPKANQSFNSPIVNPAADPDGGNTVDGNGNPVLAIGNNGAEMNWDGMDQPLLNTPDYCSASTSNGLTTTLDWFAGLGLGGVTLNTPTPNPTSTATPTPTPVPTSTSTTTATPSPVGSPSTTPSPNPYPSGVIANGPLAYYKLDETSGTTVIDYSGNHNNGTLTTPANAQLGAAGLLVGNSDTAYNFTGTPATITTPIAAGTTFTIVMLVKANSYTPRMFGVFSSLTAVGWSGGHPAVSEGLNNTGTLTVATDATHTFVDGTSYWLAFEGNTTTRKAWVSVNGGPLTLFPGAICCGEASQRVTASLNPAAVGSLAATSMLGTLDEVALYNKLLTQAQLTSLATLAGY